MRRLTTLMAWAICLLSLAPTANGQWLLHDDGFWSELFAPSDHTHFSVNRTPFVHPFTIEPPQIHEDVFFIYKYTRNSIEGTNEHEAEAHVDWSLTKRLGIVLGVPLVGNEDAMGTQNVGFGDLEIAPRVMLINRPNFIMATNFFVSVPTGEAARDLGSGETVISPFLTTWHDLGNWNTLVLNIGPEMGTDSGDTSLSYAFSLAHTWLGPTMVNGEFHEDDDHGHGVHFAPGMMSLYLEMNGETELQDDRNTFVELLPGVSYVLTEHAELRFGVLLPVSKTQRFDQQYFSSFTWIN